MCNNRMCVCTMYPFFVIIVGFLLEANINLFKAFKIGILIISLYRIEFKINGQSQSKKIFCHREEEGNVSRIHVTFNMLV